MHPAILFGGAAVLLLASGRKSSAVPRPKRFSVSCPSLRPGGGHIAGYDYIEFATGGASLQEQLPIVFFLHCRGCNPNVLAKHLEDLPSRARVVMPRGEAATNPIWFDLKARTPDQAGLAEQMSDEAQRMARFIEEANQCLLGVGDPVVTGHSQGGMLAMAVAAEAPGIMKAAVPVSGWLPVDLWPRDLPPTSVVHGTNDRTVDYARTADFVSRASNAGLPIELFPIEGHGHGLGGDLKSTWVDLVESAVQS